MSNKEIKLNTRIDPDLLDRIREAAAKDRRTVSAWLRQAAEEKLEREQKGKDQ